MSRTGFQQDLKTQSAVLHQLMILGEAVKRLSAAFREAHAEVRWTLVAGMRDRLIHGYDVVDLDQVWQTIEKDVPDLVRHLRQWLPKSTSGSGE